MWLKGGNALQAWELMMQCLLVFRSCCAATAASSAWWEGSEAVDGINIIWLLNAVERHLLPNFDIQVLHAPSADCGKWGRAARARLGWLQRVGTERAGPASCMPAWQRRGIHTHEITRLPTPS